MTEAEWLSCEKVIVPVMNWLRRHGTGRQFYLAGCAAVRHVFHALPDHRFNDLVVLVERHADGERLAGEIRRRQRSLGDEVYARFNDRRQTDEQISKAMSAQVAVLHLARPDAGWEAGYSALAEAARVGKRAEQWRWQCAMLRDIFGNPFRPKPKRDPAWLSWHDGTIPRLAQQMYDSRDFATLPILADALEEAGCSSPDMLDHCRGPAPHVRGCWVVDLLLGME